MVSARFAAAQLPFVAAADATNSAEMPRVGWEIDAFVGWLGTKAGRMKNSKKKHVDR